MTSHHPAPQSEKSPTCKPQISRKSRYIPWLCLNRVPS